MDVPVDVKNVRLSLWLRYVVDAWVSLYRFVLTAAIVTLEIILQVLLVQLFTVYTACKLQYAKQDRQCTHNVILRRVYETIVAWKSKKYYTFLCVCVCVCVGGVVVSTRTRAYAFARVALIIQHVAFRHIVICGVSDSTIFFDIISLTEELR
jgi:hypothetical protein